MGELILTSDTYDQGRIAINDSFSATAYFNNTEASGNVTGGTYYSGATPLELIIQTLAVAGSVTNVQNGTNTFTGGTGTNPTVNITAATLTYLSATTISGGTIYSGSTNLYSIFEAVGSGGLGFSGLTSSTGTYSIIENNGSGNVASQPYGYAGGDGANSNNFAEWSRTSGHLGQYGFVSYFGSTTLTPSNISQIYLDGGSSNKRFVIPADSSYFVDFTVVARVIGGGSDGDSAAWTSGGVVKNIGGVVSVPVDTGGQYFPMIAKVLDPRFLDPTVDIIISAETATSALTVTVIGPDDNVDWFVKAEYTRVN